MVSSSKERNILDLAKNLQDDLHVYCKGAAGSGDNFYARTFANLADRADELVKLLESAPETRAVNCREAGPGKGLCIECANGNYERCLYVRTSQKANSCDSFPENNNE